jgi:hypothetical protein
MGVKHRLWVFENRVLRRIFRPKRDEVMGEWRKLHNTELCDLYSSPSINLEIEEFNRKLKKITTLYNHVSMLETNFKRECFTRHGLHWNFLGKSLVVNLLLHQINK